MIAKDTVQLGQDASGISSIADVGFGLCASSGILQPPAGGPWYSGIFGLGMYDLQTQAAQIGPTALTCPRPPPGAVKRP